MNNKKILAASIFSTICSIGFVAGVNAAEVGSTIDNPFVLDTMVVTATTTPVSEKRATASMTVVSRKEIDDNHYKTLSDVLEHVPGIDSVKFADGAGFEISGESSLAMRGSSNCLVAVDGVVQKTGNSYKSYLFSMNTDDIERVEVMRGAAATLYGADAVGGVVNIITKRDYPAMQTRLTAAAGNFGYQNYHVNTNGSDEKGFWSFSYDKMKKGDYKDGAGVKTKRDMDSDMVNLRLGAHLNDETDFIVNFQNLQQNGSAAYAMPNWGLRYWTTDYHMQTLSGTLDYKSKDGKEGNAFTVLYGKWFSDRKRSAKGNQPAAKWETVDRDNIDIVNRYYRQLSDNNRIAAGVEYQRYSVATVAAPDREISERAAYLQDEWDIKDKLKLTGGIRYVSSNSYKSQWLNSLNLSYAFSDKFSIYALSNEFYKTPSTTAIFGSAAFKANPNIKPESGRNNELGMRLAFDDTARLDVSVFDRRHENAIVIQNNPAPDMNQYVNINGVTHLKGAEVSFKKDFGKYLTAKASYSRLVAEADSQIPRLPKTQYTLGLTYDRDFYNVSLQALNRSDFAPNNYFPVGFDNYLLEKNYWVWNLSANYKVKNNINVFAKVNNIFDKNYMSATQYTATGATIGEPLAYYTAQGRSFIVGMEYSF